MASDAAAFRTLAINGLRQPLDFYSSVGPSLNELSFGLLGSSFKPDRDVIDLSGKVIFVTGGKSAAQNAGIP